MDPAESAFEDQLRALEDGRAFVDQTGLRLFDVRGSDARSWLNDLVTAGVDGLPAGAAAPALLLTPTGRIRATFEIWARAGEDFLLVQDPREPHAVADLLRPYVLSSDVELVSHAEHRTLLRLPARVDAPPVGEAVTPDLLAVTLSERADAVRRLRTSGLTEAGREAAEVFRIVCGVPRFPVDVTPESLPAEHDLLLRDIDIEKGCFLGQESLAKVRNLGHPTHRVIHAWSRGELTPGSPVLEDGETAGTVTSAARRHGVTFLLARVSWSPNPHRSFTLPDGTHLHPVGSPHR